MRGLTAKLPKDVDPIVPAGVWKLDQSRSRQASTRTITTEGGLRDEREREAQLKLRGPIVDDGKKSGGDERRRKSAIEICSGSMAPGSVQDGERGIRVEVRRGEGRGQDVKDG